MVEDKLEKDGDVVKTIGAAGCRDISGQVAIYNELHCLLIYRRKRTSANVSLVPDDLAGPTMACIEYDRINQSIKLAGR